MKKYVHYITFISVLFALFLTSCDESSQIDTNDVKNALTEPVITSFQPTTGASGTEIILTGTSLSNVDSVYIGGQAVKVKNRISDTKLLVEVTANAVTGKVKAKSPKGTGESSNNFTVTTVVPSITEIVPPTEGSMTIGEIVTITGENLKAVTRIVVDGLEAQQTFVSDTEIGFIVPQATIGASVKVVIEYLNGTETQSIESTDSYTIMRPTVAPSITDCPTTGLIYNTITMTGKDMDVASAAILGGKTINFTSQSPTEIQFVIPTSFAVETKTDLILIYNGSEQMTVVKDFVVTVPAISPDVLFWGAKTIFAQDPTTTDNFFNAKTGAIYTPCDYATMKNNIYFFINWSTGNKTYQINNPNNSANSTKVFLCNGNSIGDEKMPNIVKFRFMRPDNKNEGPYYKMVRERTLGKISPEIISEAGISNATLSTPRFNNNNNPANPFVAGDVLMFQKYDSKGTTVEEVGFIEIVECIVPENPEQSSLTFNCFFQK
ncbi:IPT/TIG domain-containing protein [Dysgonomonas sp. OttesenSCG-928-D17]|nr:IPT/TIG domain-containing protein [Dysgonomonas sp. OttesenSCG-928-D17]